MVFLLMFSIFGDCLQNAWKLLHPVDKLTNRECPDDAEEYERVCLIENDIALEK